MILIRPQAGLTQPRVATARGNIIAAAQQQAAKVHLLQRAGATEGTLNPAGSPKAKAVLEEVHHQLGVEEPLRATSFAGEEARAGLLKGAVEALAGLQKSLSLNEVASTRASELTAPYHRQWRQALAADIARVGKSRRLLQGDPELAAMFRRIDQLDARVKAGLRKLDKMDAAPRLALRAEQVESPRVAAKIIERRLGQKGLAQEVLEARGELAAKDQARFDQNLSAFALLADGATATPDYQHTGMGWHYPSSRTTYRARAWEPWTMLASENRLQGSRVDLTGALRKALRSDEPAAALERALVDGFVSEIGVPADVAAGLGAKPSAVREALAQEAFTPLRALNETVDDMAPQAPWTRDALRAVVAEVTRHVARGDYRQWRYDLPTSQRQLAALAPNQKQVWKSGHSVRGKGPTQHLRTQEEDGLGLLWLTKIGGPSHGFDYGGQCLLPLLTNARTKAIVVHDARSPEHPSARAYLRMLEVEGHPPRLYLEPLQRDFLHRRKFGEGLENQAFQKVILEHALAKAKQMGLSLSVSPALGPLLRELGHAGRPSNDRYVLEPSGGVFEASDTLSAKHDWVQTEREVTRPLERLIVEP